MRGTDTDSTRMARMLADDLRQVADPRGVEVHLQDERLTSVQADRVIRATGRTAKQSKDVKDQIAASLLLQAWLDAARR